MTGFQSIALPLVNPSLSAKVGSGPWFRRDVNIALRFATESDARVFSEWSLGKGFGCRIVEHKWG